MDRREIIIKEIQKSERPLSASKLASLCGVSRQIIVGDVALLRASGVHIIATPRGYVLDESENKKRYTIAVKHSHEDMADELYTIIDNGGYIEDVIVEHPIYGQLTGKLHLSSRYDVDQFIQKTNHEKAKPLSQLTNGLHLHTVQCANEDVYQRIMNALYDKGYLYTED